MNIGFLKIIKSRVRLMEDQDYKEWIKNSGVSFLLRLVSFLLLNALSFYIAKVYGAAELGVYSLSFSILSISLVVVLIGTDTAVIRMVSEHAGNGGAGVAAKIVNRVLQLVLPVSVAAGAILYLQSDWLAHFVFPGTLSAGAIQIVALILPFFALSRLHAAAFRALQHFAHSILFEIIWIRFGYLGLMMLATGIIGKRNSIVLATLAIIVVGNGIWSITAWRLKMCKGNRSGSLEHTYEKPGLKQILALSAPMYLTSSMYVLMDWTDSLMIGIFGSAEDVGVYNLIAKLSILTCFATESINTFLVPKFSELFWGDKQADLQKMIRFSTKLGFWTSVPVILLTVLFAPYFLPLFGAKFTTGTTALILLCFGQLVNSLTGSVIPLLNMTGHQKKSKNILLVSTISNVILNPLLIPIFGMAGAALATAVSIAIRDVAASYCTWRIFRFPTWYPSFLANVVSLHRMEAE
ncbi:flippase [Fodinisporobacter ferrooxydans]|uniref:Flippase n=1 Tax=Fodinisporobacter ferrooxydans TaxID=2901836 RepID=A0ABY4CHV0_9BACL|nr:flippase [Alicyclobacillaceae bacterium MYW30-H2]